MTDAEKLQRDMDTLRDSIRRDWQDVSRLSGKAREDVLEHLIWCDGELAGLRRRLEDNLDD